jgi:uncharacterized membrane protein
VSGTLVLGDDGGAVAACVRPNDVRLAPLDDARAVLPPNAFAAEVILASFEGAFIHYQARCTGGLVWDAIGEVSGALRVGSTVCVSVAPAAMLLLPRNHG